MKFSCQEFDLIIMGGGIVGLTLTALLRHSDRRIALIDPNLLLHPTAHEQNHAKNLIHGRVSAINHAAEKIFTQIGLWENIKPALGYYESMFVWDAGSDAQIAFDCTEIGQSHLGHIAPNAVLQTALLDQLQQESNIHFYHSVPKAVLSRQDAIQIRLGHHEIFSTKLLIGADGNESWTAKAVGIPIHTQPYQQFALVTTVITDQPHAHTAWQRFLFNDILAFLPLPNTQHCSVVWSTSPEKATHLQNLSEPEFNAHIAQAFGHRLGTVQTIAPRHIFPLKKRLAKRYVMPRVALIGDAAHTLHPLAGQGLNLGLLDAQCLAKILLSAWQLKQDVGRIDVLKRYERARQGENWFMANSMTGIKELFSHHSVWATWLREAGLKWADKLPGVKSFLMKRAMGL